MSTRGPETGRREPISGRDGQGNSHISGILHGGAYVGGAAYVVFGRTEGFHSPVNLDNIAAGHGGFVLQGMETLDNLGLAISQAELLPR